MMPLGFMAARYLKAVGPRADPLWFYVHITLQLPGYLLGMAGGATGLYLGIKSAGVHHPCHKGIGITLFCLGLLHISALFLRPAKDHKYKNLWNWFHHLTGYTVLLLSFTNIWVGFYILKPAKTWIIVYGVISGAMIVSTIVLEVWKRLTQDGNTIGANEASATSTREDNKVLGKQGKDNAFSYVGHHLSFFCNAAKLQSLPFQFFNLSTARVLEEKDFLHVF
ncbi:hypothetical protein RHMOL_Rhmol02G0101500 [Rhododendron molle]|uniref:Uncharacterized protein n=1 Tax=Rhododendron molle TaxID=49168 RepID=A0ACC0PQV6_RHOML|nr:hypothetical protein RHMOL_Rhmol02G0101500 [Rhododendron molle]